MWQLIQQRVKADPVGLANIPPLQRIEAQAFKRQQIAFCVLTLAVIAALLILHAWFASLLGEPSRWVMLVLGTSFLAKALEWSWLATRTDGIGQTTAWLETAISTLGLFLLTWVLAVLTDRDDAPYFVLLAIAILQCAYHFGLLETILTIAAAITMMFGWATHYFAVHPPPRPTEFLESGMISVIYSLMGILVWYLVTQLGKKEQSLFQSMAELEAARERLASEEKLAAVGRLASGIAHEIRNPVAMIASSLATATYPNADPEEREEMFAIATREAKRLETLTTDFLAYARPSSPQRAPVQISEVLEHIASVARVGMAERRVEIMYDGSADVVLSIDPFQVEAALVNVAMNAVAASAPRGTIAIRSRVEEKRVLFEIENSGRKIPESELGRIFEPFFTTKTGGTGLGLAIARGVARAHGGDLWVSKNEDGAVAFTMSLAAISTTAVSGDYVHG